jgi:hypothetical protein
MRNSIISIALFAMLLGFLFYANGKLTGICEHILKSSEETETLITEENWEKSYDNTVALIDYIKDNSSAVALYVNHTDFDNLNIEASKLSQYIKYHNPEEALASLHAIKFSTNYILDLQEVSIKNIF